MSVKIHFLNVGEGDCSIVHSPPREVKNSKGEVTKSKDERIMMIDLYHHDNHEEYENIIEYYKSHPDFKEFNGSLKPIFRFVCSHPHKDHISGLTKIFNDNDIRILNFWDLDHEFEPVEFQDDNHKDDWATYLDKRRSKESPKVLRFSREDNPGDFWKDDEDRITILSPSKFLRERAHYNEDGTRKEVVEIDEMSYALSISINNTKVIFAGDGKERCWQDIYDNCKDIIMNCDILKAGHHGHESGLHIEAVKHMNPKHVVISNSEEKDDESGAAKKYAQLLPNTGIYRTCDNGTLIAECGWKGEIEFRRAENG